MTPKKDFLSLLFPIAALVLIAGVSQADTIKMKDGTTHEGKITYEADDIVKIEIPISASIKETKILARGDILNIVKDAPDDLKFNEIKKLVPTASMMSADAYQKALKTGPEAFLQEFPDSVHVEFVKEIKATLEEELEKVERGYIKIEEDWISPQEKTKYDALVNSRIRYLRMEASGNVRSAPAIINAMREFEHIEENFSGSPAYAKGVELARKILPVLGSLLQKMSRDVDFQNAEYERTKAQLDEVARQQIEAARDREEKQFQAALAADQKAGIKWVRLNPRSKTSIQNYLSLAGSELKRMEGYDLEALKKQGQVLVEADKLATEGDIRLAKAKLDDAASMPVRIGDETSKKKSSSKKSKSSSYIGIIRTKISDREKREVELAKARKDAEDSKALAAKLKDDRVTPTLVAPKAGDQTASADAAEAGTDTEASEETAPKEKPEDAFAALAKAKAAKAKAKAEKADSEKKSSSKSKKDDDRDDEEDERDRERESSGGGFSLPIIPIVTVLLVITVVALKFLGIGGKKKDAAE